MTLTKPGPSDEANLPNQQPTLFASFRDTAFWEPTDNDAMKALQRGFA
jgi:hypothetical protein